jgi:hypothetical protein
MKRRLFESVMPLCAGFLAFGVLDCYAQDLPGEGKFSITYTAVNPAPAKGVVVGKDREATVSALLMTAVNDAGSGLLHNMAGRCISLVIVDRSAKTLDVRGYCNYADRGGDQVFEEFSTPTPVALGGPVKYAGKWVGGTGKFTGLSGDFEISTSGNVAPEGLFQAAGKKTGSYKISK